MNPSQQHSPSESHERSYFDDHHHVHARSTVSWGAIFSGAVAALALHVLFMMLGAGLGLAIFSPLTEENPVADLSVSALIIHSICAIIALCFGGWVAGRFSPIAARTTGWLHGFSVWTAATVGGVIMVALGAGAMLGGLTKLVGEPAAAVADGVAEVAADGVKKSGETMASFVDEAVGNLPEDRSPNEGIRAKREIGFAVARLFNPAEESDTAANRAAATSALVDYAGMSQAEADRAVMEWTATYERLRADLAEVKKTAEEKARKAADTAASALAKFSLWAFVGFLIGALAATWGGHVGAKCATKCEEMTDRHPHQHA